MNNPTIGVVCHFFNEELLMEGFCRHHKDMFDDVICINHQSTDASVEIIKEVCPEWTIVNTALANFDAAANDREVEYWETQLSTDLKLALNITEWVFNKDLQPALEMMKEFNDTVEGPHAWGMLSACLVDKPETVQTPDPKWHTHGYVDRQLVTRRPRFIHNADHGHYALGRHSVGLPARMCNQLLLHWTFAPYPTCQERKLQIQTRIPQHNKDARLGFEHIQTPESLVEFYHQHLARSSNLLDDPDYRQRYEEYYGAREA